MDKAIPITALAFAASVSMTAYAQTSETTRLDPIIVSGGISPVTADEYGRSNTILTRRDIEERGYATVQQALEGQPGISINGTSPNDRQVRIRGGEANQTLILVDGVRVDAGVTNGYNLRSLNLGSVDRIEVLRGPQSVPFGTGASSGVINIVTREAGQGTVFGAEAEVGEGHRESAYVTHGDGRKTFSFTASKLYDEGYDFSGEGGEKDSTRWETVTSKGEYDLTDSLTVGFNTRIASGNYDYDDTDSGAKSASGYVVDDPSKGDEVLERFGSLYLEKAMLGQALVHRIRLDRTSNQSSSVTDKQTELLNYRLQYGLDERAVDQSDHLLSMLVERKTDSEDASSNERENESVALEYNGFLSPDLGLQAGARFDESDQFDDALSWNAALSYDATARLRFHGSVGRAVVYPTFLQVYGGTFLIGGVPARYVGNENLEAETNTGFDVGFEYTVGERSNIGLIYFNDALENEITTNSNLEYVNSEGDSDRRGVELTGRLGLTDEFSLRGSYIYTESRNDDDQTEARRPENEINLGVRYGPSEIPLTLDADLRYVDNLLDVEGFGSFEPKELPSFTTVNFAAEYSLTDNVDLTARITNAFDEDYQEVWGYATRGRAGFVGVRTTW
ncbi:TonB-dependent receptor plug domain-containing protein [Spiribacter vilamensis]|uniref:Vitamin B12 transporter n=1 Tax=Spiribacter vilamensis TaxID=531306 RepID=A0A4Q8D1W0_9GAMM|nr:TonB-dependent receptor [Spiribacter vilamensis]RZU99338.1 vitamin B12 transporter [Spiribacter vilamensis]TVO61678.1 TonB-dependent receptor [Spiribacter vilamensis]